MRSNRAISREIFRPCAETEFFNRIGQERTVAAKGIRTDAESFSLMALTSWPRAYFELPRGGQRAAAEEVATLASCKLQCEYRSIERVKIWPFPLLLVRSDKETLVLSVRPYKTRGVSILVTPLNAWSPIDLLRGKERPVTPGLQTFCAQIHSVVKEVRDIVELRWYLKGATESVGTPDLLPW